MFENIYRHSVNDSRQPGAGQSTLAAQHLHLQPQDLQGGVYCWSPDCQVMCAGCRGVVKARGSVDHER